MTWREILSSSSSSSRSLISLVVEKASSKAASCCHTYYLHTTYLELDLLSLKRILRIVALFVVKTAHWSMKCLARRIIVVATAILSCVSFEVNVADAFLPQQQNQINPKSYHRSSSTICLHEMKRPILDQVASTLFRLENARVEASSVVDEKGRKGEPMEWSDSSSIANQFSEIVSSNSLGYMFKQWVADIVAGDYEEEVVASKIDAFVQDNKVAMFSFSTCPFCRRAKDFLDENGIEYQAMEIDELDGNEGNQIRAMLGRKTKRTSVPSIFVAGQFIGGCNDGPGLLPLAQSGELEKMLSI